MTANARTNLATRAQPSRLAQASAGAVPEREPTKLAKALTGARVRVSWMIPRLDLPVAIALVPYRDQERIDAEVDEIMRASKVEFSIRTEARYEAARAVRWFAIAFLDPDTDQPIGTLEDWQAIDTAVISACWRRMADVRAAHDPASVPLTPEEIAEITDAVKKKDETLLRFFGVAALASFLLTTDTQLQTSATPTQSSSDS